jgi:hypothetical protein
VDHDPKRREWGLLVSDILARTYDSAIAVTPSDTTADPAGPFAALYMPATGNLKITTVRGTAVTFTAVPAGTFIPVATQRVWATGSQGGGANVVGLLAMPYKGSGQ